MKNIDQKLKSLKAFFLDADGVYFDGQEHLTKLPDGRLMTTKNRSYQDGQGLSFLRELGIRIIFISGVEEPLKSIVERSNIIPSAASGRWAHIEVFTNRNTDKLDAMQSWLSKNNISIVDVAYMGDDKNDLECLKIVQKEGISVCPANATRVAKAVADIVTKNSGGNGAIREFVEMILDARGVDEAGLPVA